MKKIVKRYGSTKELHKAMTDAMENESCVPFGFSINKQGELKIECFKEIPFVPFEVLEELMQEVFKIGKTIGSESAPKNLSEEDKMKAFKQFVLAERLKNISVIVCIIAIGVITAKILLGR